LFKKIIIIFYIDFDGTIQDNGYPEIGSLNEDCSEVLWKLYNLGFTLILNTYRADLENGSLESALEFIKLHNLPIFNHNKIKIKPKRFNPTANEIFIDDEADNIPLKKSNKIYNKNVVCWLNVRKVLTDSSII
jgi:hypothetical protein